MSYTESLDVLLHPAAQAELEALPLEEKVSMHHAFEKLGALGVRLPFPHQSAVRGAGSLRELRPRGGRSPWRALYQRVESAFVVAAIGPEAKIDRRGFETAVARAVRRIAEIDRPPPRTV